MSLHMAILDAQRLKISNLDLYLNNQDIKAKSKLVLGVPSLEQSDYGQANDCTITSLTAYIGYLVKNKAIVHIYNSVADIAKKYGYNGYSRGTNPFCIKTIFNQALKANDINQNTKVRYLKNIGFNYNLIKNNINNKIPMVLSLWRDGREYYDNHSVLIVGYYEVQLENKKIKRFLQVFDNWKADYSLIDYDKLSVISCINYI